MKYFLLIILVLICTVSCVNAGDNDTVDDSIIVDNDEHVLIGIGDEDIQNEIIILSGLSLIAWSDNIGENPFNLEYWALFGLI